jgi:hypothetical protein
MKKLFVSAMVLAIAALGMTPGHAAADVSGTIMLPTPMAGTGNSGTTGTFDCHPPQVPDTGSQDCEKGPLARATRCTYYEVGPESQPDGVGVTGYVIPIGGETTFRLESVPADSADFDVTFYVDFAPCDGATPTYAAGVDYTHAHFGNGAESGAIPEETSYAIVTLFGSAAQTFKFTAS